MNHLTSGAVPLTVEASDLISPTALPGGQSAYHARVALRRAESLPV